MSLLRNPFQGKLILRFGISNGQLGYRFFKPQLLFLELLEGKYTEMFSLKYHRVERNYRRGDNKHWFRSHESRHRQCEKGLKIVSNHEVTTLKLLSLR